MEKIGEERTVSKREISKLFGGWSDRIKPFDPISKDCSASSKPFFGLFFFFFSFFFPSDSANLGVSEWWRSLKVERSRDEPDNEVHRLLPAEYQPFIGILPAFELISADWGKEEAGP